MSTYQSTLLGLQMTVPDGWVVRSWPDDGVEELIRHAETREPISPGLACSGATRPLLYAYLYAPGCNAVTDARIEMIACNDDFFKIGEPESLKLWNVNGIEILYSESTREGSLENSYYRFPRWSVATGVWLYATLHASGRQRFEYVLSVFENLSRVGSTPQQTSTPLFAREPWNAAPSIFRLNKLLEDKGPLYDLVFDEHPSEAALKTNNAILRGRTSPKRWKAMTIRRKSRVRSLDMYYGPDALYSSGIFSQRPSNCSNRSSNRTFPNCHAASMANHSSFFLRIRGWILRLI